MKKHPIRAVIVAVLAIIIIGAAFYFAKGVPAKTVSTSDYVNTKFGYELHLPAGWSVYTYSYEPDIASRLIADPKYKDIASKYQSLQQIQQADPSLFDQIKSDYTSAQNAWNPQTAETIVFTNGDQSYADIFGPDKIDVFLTSTDPATLNSSTDISTTTEEKHSMTFANGYKGYVRTILSPGQTGTVALVYFGGNEHMMSGQTANSIMLTLAGKVDPDLLVSIANSMKATK